MSQHQVTEEGYPDPRARALFSYLSQMQPRSWWDPSHLSRMLALTASENLAFDRGFYEPGHFTASGFVVSSDHQQLLLILHRKLDMWLQPGGHIDPDDEDWVGAARREVQEETGLGDLELLTKLIDVDIHQIPALGQTPSHLHYDLRVLFQSSSCEVRGADDAADARWFALSTVADSAEVLWGTVGTDKSVRSMARQLMALLSPSSKGYPFS